MKRLLILLTLSGFAMACGDDDGDDSPGPVDAGGDAKADTGTLDSSVGGKVTNVGAACTQGSQCTGMAATCATVTPIGQAFPGGYCSATCSTSAECGAEGACPLGELISLAPDNPLLTGLAGQCWDKCTTAGQVSNCRTGYTCTTLGMVVGMNLPVPQLSLPVCLPANISLGDGGTGDASVVDASGIDSSI
jgi:hypothetical protein